MIINGKHADCVKCEHMLYSSCTENLDEIKVIKDTVFFTFLDEEDFVALPMLPGYELPEGKAFPEDIYGVIMEDDCGHTKTFIANQYIPSHSI